LKCHPAADLGQPIAQKPAGCPDETPPGIAADHAEYDARNHERDHPANHHANDLDARARARSPSVNHADHGADQEPGNRKA